MENKDPLDLLNLELHQGDRTVGSAGFLPECHWKVVLQGRCSQTALKKLVFSPKIVEGVTRVTYVNSLSPSRSEKFPLASQSLLSMLHHTHKSDQLPLRNLLINLVKNNT